MIGREKKEYNDLFFVCSLIEYIARLTKNERKHVVNAIGANELQHIYQLAEVYHSENIDKIAYNLIKEYHIGMGIFDNITNSGNSNVPSYWDIGKVYKRLIIEVSEYKKASVIDTLVEVYNSWIPEKIDNYDSSMYYENPSYLFNSYIAGQPL